MSQQTGPTQFGLLERPLSRRGLLIGASVGACSIGGLWQAIDVLQAVAKSPSGKPLAAPSSDPVRATMRAYADTIVPGSAGGADPAPGAIEAGVVDEIYDPVYNASGAYPFLHEDIQLATPRVLGRLASFDLSLPYPDRERVVRDRIVPPNQGGANSSYLLYAATAILVYIAYYGTARSDLGVRYIGLPPHSNGYYPHHSYGICFAGMTRDGNPS